jgi:hypothetical protein
MAIPVASLITLGVLACVYLTWMLGVIFLVASPVPWLWLIKRYYDSTPWKYEMGNKIVQAEHAYLLMPKEKQKEYRDLIDAVYRGSLSANEAKSLFEQYSQVNSIRDRLKAELEQRREQQKILEELNESTGLADYSGTGEGWQR